MCIHTTAEQTTHTNTERATAQRRLEVEVVVAAPKLPPSAALLLSSLLPTRGTGFGLTLRLILTLVRRGLPLALRQREASHSRRSPPRQPPSPPIYIYMYIYIYIYTHTYFSYDTRGLTLSPPRERLVVGTVPRVRIALEG